MENNSLNTNLFKNHSFQVAFTIFSVGILLIGVGVVFQSGLISRESASELVGLTVEEYKLQLVALQDNLTALQSFLSNSWNPTYYTTSDIYDFSILHPDGVNGSLWYCVKKGSTGGSLLNTQNSSEAMEYAVDNLSNGGWIGLNADVAWDSLISIPAGILVFEYLNTTGWTIYDAYGDSNINSAIGQQDYSYLIYQRNVGGTTTYYAKNGTDGSISFSSTVFSDVYNDVSAVCTVTGGVIQLSASTVFTSAVGLSGYSNVAIVGEGATLQINSNTAGVHALTFNNVVNSVWRGVNVERVGVNASGSYVLYLLGATDESTKFLDCNFTNLVTGLGGTSCHGVASAGSSASSFSGCTISGGLGETGCYGVYSYGSSASSFSDCTISGGSGGTVCYGVYSDGSSALSFSGCTISGGLGGTYCHGVISYGSSASSFSGCTISGGSGETGCHGVASSGSSALSFSGCTISGGSGGPGCYGVYSDGSSALSFSGCTISGGLGGTYCYGVASYGSSASSFSDCTINIQSFSQSWAYISADDGRFQPFSVHPYILKSIYVNVVSATSGVTLDLGTTIAGTEIVSNIDISTTGSKYFNFTSPVEVAGDAYFYATPSGATADGAFIVYYVVSTNYASSYGVVFDTKGYSTVSGCTIISNGASDAIRINSNSVSYPYFKVTNCHIESLDAVNQYAVSASGALSDAPIYNSVLVHSLLNVVPDAGTQQGTNWQDPLVAYEEKLPITNDYATKLLGLVAKEKLDGASLYFTNTPLTSLICLEGLDGKALDEAIKTNAVIEAQNAVLIKNAKSFEVIVLEKTGKTISEFAPIKKITPPTYLDTVK